MPQSFCEETCYSNGLPKYVNTQSATRYTLISDWIPETVLTQPVVNGERNPRIFED
jgi:hypothetical protein